MATGAPTTQYARSGDYNIAYQVVGEGETDLVYVPGLVSHLELFWEEPAYSRFLHRLASFSRLILMDRLGTGLSDRIPNQVSTPEQRMDDVRAVMDAVGSERAAVRGLLGGRRRCARCSPPRTRADDRARDRTERYARTPRTTTTLGDAAGADRRVPREIARTGDGRGRYCDSRRQAWRDERGPRQWCARFNRARARARAPPRRCRMNNGDRRARTSCPQSGCRRWSSTAPATRADRSSAAATWRSSIPGAKLVELPGDDHLPWIGDQDAILDEVEEFLTGARHELPSPTGCWPRSCSPTSSARPSGPRSWATVAGASCSSATTRSSARELDRHRGREVDTAGDGFLATFDGPARAIRCASAIADAVRPLGIEIRAGLHTGECEVMNGDVGGIAVHIGARVAALAGPGEVLVSSTVKDLVAGSGIEFEDRGTHELKGIPGEWRLFAVAR